MSKKQKLNRPRSDSCFLSPLVGRYIAAVWPPLCRTFIFFAFSFSLPILLLLQQLVHYIKKKASGALWN
jgi:hypothetical protein